MAASAHGQTFISEPARQVPVTGAYDVVVAGGGIAGVAAAVAAARQGASVCLLEKAYALGGLATLGNVVVWLPICDGKGRQVMSGLAEELLRLSVSDLSLDNPSARMRGVPRCWQADGDAAERRKERFKAEFNPASLILAVEKLVTDCGVTLLYDTRVCAVRTEGQRITHLIVENKSGRSAVACSVVIDATGDADVCYLAGEETESLDSNVLAGWFYTFRAGELKLHQLSRRYSPVAGKEGATGPFFRGDDAADVTAQVMGTRELIRQQLAELRARWPNSDVQPLALPTLACFRMTRRLVGSMSLGERHMHQWFDDAVGLTGDWRKAGPVYAIPYRALCGVRTENLLAAGRCISADTTVWDVTRAIPTCALTGEAAGTAAALAVQQCAGNVHALAPAILQNQLQQRGALLDPALVAPAP